MKYSLNQHYKFSYYWVVFSVYFVRFIIILLIEIANILVIIKSDSLGDVVQNFVALAIIIQFSEFYYENISIDVIK
jgi:hypothetical protein